MAKWKKKVRERVLKKCSTQDKERFSEEQLQRKGGRGGGKKKDEG